MFEPVDWTVADVHRKEKAKNTDLEDYPDRHIARAILKQNDNDDNQIQKALNDIRKWKMKDVHRKADAGKFDYDDHDDKEVARAIRARYIAQKEMLPSENKEWDKRIDNLGFGNLSVQNQKAPARNRSPPNDRPNTATQKQVQPKQTQPPAPKKSTSSTSASVAGARPKNGENRATQKQAQPRKRERSPTRDSSSVPSKKTSNTVPRRPQPGNGEGSSGTRQPAPVYELATNEEGNYICKKPGCEKAGPWGRKYDYFRHVNTVHDASKLTCEIGACASTQPTFSRSDTHRKHLREKHPETSEGRDAEAAYQKSKASRQRNAILS